MFPDFLTHFFLSFVAVLGISLHIVESSLAILVIVDLIVVFSLPVSDAISVVLH
jgi:hypothetical protein